MRDKVKDDEHITRCKQWLAAAERVAILGFSFDQINTDRLALASIIGPRVNQQRSPPVTFAATRFRLSNLQARRAAHRCGFKALAADELNAHFFELDCAGLLKEALFLDE